MRRFLLSAILLVCMAMGMVAQVTNYAIRFDKEGTVDCGPLPSLDDRSSFLIQFWINPSEWVEGAIIMQRGDGLKISLAEEGNVHFSIGGSETDLIGVPTGEWSLVSYRNNDGIIYINNKRKGTAGNPMPVEPSNPSLILGGGYKGLLDEIRIWSSSLNDEFNRFEHTTLNKWCPNLNDLLVYYKMDNELCPNLVNYKDIFCPNSNEYNNHGVFSETGVTREAVDNPLLPYLTNSAYTANERFYDRAIPRDQYLLSNDLIILGVESLNTGHVRTCTPNNHATINGAQWLESFEGRDGVMSFDGSATLDCGTDIMRPNTPGFTLETWIYIDEWVPGAYLLRKETADSTQGFSVRLGAESNHEVIVRINGKNFYNQRMMRAGQWTHLAIGVNGGDSPSKVLWWIYDGDRVGYGSSKCDDSLDSKPVGNEECHGIIGAGFKGKLDEFAIWDKTMARGDIAQHMNGLPMPGLNKVVTSDLLQRANTYLKFDDPANPGYSSYSQDEWKRIMEEAYKGYRGFRTRISVKSHNGWESTITNSAKRKIFAADLAEISKPYDGAELDLEWMYGEQTYLGLLAKDIREALPEGKSLMISCHNVAYRFPKSDMDYCDGFTFQQYGPQSEHSRYSHFKSMTDVFVAYGFPKEKILCSYATTTSEGYSSKGQRIMPIKGVKDGFMEEGYTADPEVDFGESGGYTYYFDGPLQTYMRAKYVTDQRLGGIFYWDMGNDCRPEHPNNLAKWCSYGLNANVDSLVTEVDVRHIESSGIIDITSPTNNSSLTYLPKHNSIIITASYEKCPEALLLYTIDGILLRKESVVANRVDGLSVASGLYIAKVVFSDGSAISRKLTIRH